MRLFELKKSELKTITQFLHEKKIVLHPKISPDGIPDFTGYEDREIIIIFDRNLFVYLINLLQKGELNDNHKRKLISSLMFWIGFNGFSVTAGMALAEYANFNNGNKEADQEFNIFKNMYNNYSIKYWLDLALGRCNTIPEIEGTIRIEANFHSESSHLKMHYLEMLILAQLFYNEEISIIDKFKKFFDWVYQNIIICSYTTCLSAKILSGKSKIFNLKRISFEELDKVCINQAWDLTYLSIWSTFYWYEQKSNNIYLFATADKELREIFSLTNMYPEKIFTNYLGEQRGNQIEKINSNIYLERAKKEIDDVLLNEIIEIERDKLKNHIEQKYEL